MLSDTFEIVNKYGTLYVAFHGLKAHDNAETWTTSYGEETIYVKLRDVVNFLAALGVRLDAVALQDMVKGK